MSDDLLNLIPFHPFKSNSSSISKDIRYNAIDSQSGILVSVADKGLYFYDTNSYEENSFNSNDRRDKLINVDYILKIELDSEISWAEFNCSGSYLLIAIVSDSNFLTKINVIDVQKTLNERKTCIVCSFESNDVNKIQDVKWHPIDEYSVLVVMNNIVHLCIIKDNNFVIINSKSNAFCVSWSPKGKQFVVVMRKEGSNNFFLNQYDIMMVEKRSTEIMSINNELNVNYDLIPIEACWYSTYNCIIGFRGDTSGNERFRIFVCNVAIKTNTIQILKDVGSSSDCINPNPGPCARLYYVHILEWNTIILVNNSSEYAVIYEYDNDNNLQMIQTYCLPVDGNVIGLACDFSSNKTLPDRWLSPEIKQSSSNPILFLKLSNSDCFGIYLQHSIKKITTTTKMPFTGNSFPNDSHLFSQQTPPNQLNNTVVSSEKKPENSISNEHSKSILFGLPQINQETKSNFNLFGNNDQNKPKLNLFGSTNKDETNKSNLFGIQKQANEEIPEVNIFVNQGQSSNLFGNQDKEKPPASSNLFGNQDKEKPPASSNLFGNLDKSTSQNQGQASSNLFGNQNKEKISSNQEKPMINIFVNQGQSSSNLFGNQDKSTSQNQGQSSSNLFGNQNKEKPPGSSNLFGNLDKSTSQSQGQSASKLFATPSQEKTLNHDKISASPNQDKKTTLGKPNQPGTHTNQDTSSNLSGKVKFSEKSILSGDENPGSSSSHLNKDSPLSSQSHVITGRNKEITAQILGNLQRMGSGDHEKLDKKKENTLSRQVLSATKSTSQNKVDMIDNFLPEAIKCLENRINEIKFNTNSFIRISKNLLSDDRINKEISNMFRDIEQHGLDLDRTDKENKKLIDKSKTLFQDIEITLEFTTRFQEAITESKIKNKQFKPSTNPLLKKISLNLDDLMKKVEFHLKDLEEAIDYSESKRNGKTKIIDETIQSQNIDHLLRSNFKCIKVERSKIDLLSKHLNDSLSLSNDLLQPKMSNFQSRFSNLEMEKHLHSLICKRPVINLSCKLSENKPPINIEKKPIKTPTKHSLTNKKSNEMIKTEPRLISATPPKPVTVKLVERNSYKIDSPNSFNESVTLTNITKPIQSSNSYPEMLSKENTQINTSSSFVNKDKNIQSSGIKDELEIKSTELVSDASKSNESIFSNKSILEKSKFQGPVLTPKPILKSQDPDTSKPLLNLVENLPIKSSVPEDLSLSENKTILKTHKPFTTVTSSTTPTFSLKSKSSDIIPTSNKTSEGVITSPDVSSNEILKTPSFVSETGTKLESIVNTTQLSTSSTSSATAKSSNISNLESTSTIQSSKSNSGLFGSITQPTGLFNTFLSKPTNNLRGSTIPEDAQSTGFFVASTSSKSSLSAFGSTPNTVQPGLVGNSNTNTVEPPKNTPNSQFKFTDNSNTLIQSNAGLTSTSVPSNSNNLTQSNSLFGSPSSNVQPSGIASPKPNLFGSTNKNSTSVFGSSNLFGNSNVVTQSVTGLFGTPTTSSVNSKSSGIFSTTTNATQIGGGLFGNSKITSSNNTNLFGSSDNTTQSNGFETNSSNKTTPVLFGDSAQTTSSAKLKLFGSNASNQTNNGLFGNSNQSTGGIFVSPKSSVTSQSTELFSTPTQNKSNVSGGLFGNSSVSSQNNLFGSPANANTQSTGLFNQTSANTTKTNLFGGSVQPVGGNLFSSSTTTTTQSSGLFGNQSINNNATGGLFGNSSSSSTSTSTGFFGNKAPSPNATLFASPGQNNNQQSSSALFGTPTNQTSIFSSTNSKTEDSVSGISFGGSFISGLGNNQSSNNTKNIFAPESIGGSSSSTSNLFSKNQSSTPGNLFNNSSSSNTGTLFGNNSPATSQTSSLFGSRPVFGATNQNNAQTGGLFSNSVFGNSSDNQMTFGDVATNNQSQSGFGMNTSNQPGNIFKTTTSPSFTQRRM